MPTPMIGFLHSVREQQRGSQKNRHGRGDDHDDCNDLRDRRRVQPGQSQDQVHPAPVTKRLRRKGPAH